MRTLKLFSIAFSAFLFSVLFSSNVNAQVEYPLAKINKELYVQLRALNDTEKSARTYKASLDHLALESEAAATRFFSHFKDDEKVQFEIKFDENTVLVHLNDPAGETWSFEEWAMYFKMKVAEQRKQEGYIDFRTR